MKKTAAFLCLILVIGVLTGCAKNLNYKEETIQTFNKNKTALTEAVQSNDFEQAKKIPGIEDIDIFPGYVDFRCGGWGLAPSSTYYGFFYSAEDDLTAWSGGVCPQEELVESGDGFLWEEKDGDNSYYVEKIGERFFYYEAHF